MTQKLVIIGAGGFGREVLDVIEAINSDHASKGRGPLEVLGFLDDGEPNRDLLVPYGVSHLGPVTSLADMPNDVGYVIGVGDPETRRRLDIQWRGRPSPTLVHPSVTMGREVSIGPGSVICSHVSITNHVTIGRHVHINLNSTVGHDAALGDYVTLSPLVAISGNVTASQGVFLGTGSTVNPGLNLGVASTVGSGSVVIRDVNAGELVVGVPAKVR